MQLLQSQMTSHISLVRSDLLLLGSKALVALLSMPKAEELSNGTLKMMMAKFIHLHYTMPFMSLSPHFASFAPNTGPSKRMITTPNEMKPDVSTMQIPVNLSGNNESTLTQFRGILQLTLVVSTLPQALTTTNCMLLPLTPLPIWNTSNMLPSVPTLIYQIRPL